MDARDEFVLVEGLCHVIVGAEAETFDFVLDAGEAGKNENGRVDLAHAQRLQNLVTDMSGRFRSSRMMS